MIARAAVRLLVPRSKPYYYQVSLWSGFMDVWTDAEAKANFSEVIDRALEDGPQTIMRDGKTAAVVVSAEEWARTTVSKGSLLEFLSNSPLAEANLSFERSKELPRDIEL